MDGRYKGVKVTQIKQLRRESALSLRELAERSGVAHDTINKLENGQRGAHPRTIRKIAAALGVEPRELMTGKEGEDNG